MTNRKKDKSDYSKKFKDPRWQKLRLKVFERDEWSCQMCGNIEETLAVHHCYYIQDKDPWDYPIHALRTLCEECHEIEYYNRRYAENSLLEALRRLGYLSGHVEILAHGLYLLTGESLLVHEKTFRNFGVLSKQVEASLTELITKMGENKK